MKSIAAEAASRSYDASAAWKGAGNEANATGMNSSQGSLVLPPYQSTKLPISEKAALTSADCGAGNRCTFESIGPGASAGDAD